MINIIFVCLGNICRSPMAEAIFQEMVNEASLSDQFHIDSAGTGDYHVGDPAYYRTRRILKNHGINYVGQSRQINRTDLKQSDYIIAMDSHNISDLRYIAQGGLPEGQLHLLLEFADSTIKDVPDPYYSNNFEQTYNLVNIGCQGLLAYIKEEHKL